MTSLFDTMRETALPVDLMMREMRGVSLLEFLPLSQAIVPAPENAVAEAKPELVVDERALQVAAMIDAAREEAGAAVRRVCDAEFAARLEAQRARATLLGAEFAEDRQRYLAAAEAEVVKLALAVARRILLREVEADAMYLTAVVRAALARVRDGSRTTLRVHPDEALDWVELGLAEVHVVADERVTPGECVLETNVGRVELGVGPQMAEIECCFAEMADRRRA